MFLSSFEKMRAKLLRTKNITNLMHMENMVMGIAFGTAVTVMQNAHINAYKGTYNQIKLQDIENGVPKEFPVSGNRFAQVSTDNFSKIPGSPVAYWVKPCIQNIFASCMSLADIAKPRVGLQTSNNEKFLRFWYETPYAKMRLGTSSCEETKSSGGKWFPHNKGGEFRKWYGNNFYVVNYENDGFDIKSEKAENLRLGLIEKKNS